MTNVIEFQDVSKKYGGRGSRQDTEALRQVSFSVKQGEFISVIGPSGCGKTTCLRILAGLETYDSGTVLVSGQPLTGPGRDRATVFQSFNLFPWMSVLDNVAFPLKAQGVGKTDRRKLALQQIEMVGLGDFKNHFPYQLSGGMQQRVGIARALASRADILLMDEPFGALDAQTREALQDELLSILERERKTVVFVTHSIDESVYMSDRILLFHPRPGRLSEIFDVPFGRSRKEDKIRSLPEFGQLRERVADRLKSPSLELA